MALNNSVEKGYRRFAELRDFLFRPIAKGLTSLGLGAAFVSNSGIFLMLGFIFFVRTKPLWALAFLVSAASMDFVDGVVARYQHTDSDKGKFVDMVADNVIFSLFVVGLAYAGLATGVWPVAVAYFMVMSKLFRVVHNAFDYNSDWHFKCIAGFLPNVIAGLVYFSYPFFLMSKQNPFPYVMIFSSLVLLADAVVFYNKVLHRK